MTRRRLVVVGNGMAGARFVENLIASDRDREFEIVVFGDEPHGNYNRILLSGVLAGTHRSEDIMINPLEWYADNGVRLHAGTRVEGLELGHRVVRGANGVSEPYDLLVLATGSRPTVPPIHGLRTATGELKEGVFVFRTLEDCQGIMARAQSAHRAIVVGGGLLGLEAARGLRNRGLEVQVVHLTRTVMDTQLDPQGGRILQRQLEQMGLGILTARSTAAVLGDTSVTGVRFADDEEVACDMIVVTAGIRPNIELAKAAGLAIDRGVLVGDDLACDGHDNVFAIGECSEHRGCVYGLVAPLWEQAQILADRLTARPDARYTGSQTTTKLKVAGLDVAVMGVKDPLDENDEIVSYAEPARGIYKKLILHENRLVGAILIGDGPGVPAIAQAFMHAAPLAARRSDILFPLDKDVPVRKPEEMSDDTQICDCNAVAKARIVDAVLRGATSLHSVGERTRAGTGCGSCKPEVQRVIDLAMRSMDEPELLQSVAPREEPPNPAAARVTVDGPSASSNASASHANA